METDNKESLGYLSVLTGSTFTLAIISCAMIFHFAKDVFVPFIMSLFLFYSINPLPSFLVKKFKVSRALAIFISFILIGSIISLLVLGAFSSINSFLQDLSLYQVKLHTFIEKSVEALASFGIEINKSQVKAKLMELPIFNFSRAIASFASGLIGNALLIMLLLAFIFVSSNAKENTNPTLTKIGQSISLYTDTKIAVSLMTAILSYLIMALLKLDLAIMFAILTFVLNFIPNIGSLVATLIPLPIALVQFGLGPQFFVLIIILPVIQFIIGSVVEPKIMGKGLGIHPIIVLISLILWGLIWGVSGMFLSVPITAAIKIICQEFDYTKRISQIIEGDI